MKRKLEIFSTLEIQSNKACIMCIHTNSMQAEDAVLVYQVGLIYGPSFLAWHEIFAEFS